MIKNKIKSIAIENIGIIKNYFIRMRFFFLTFILLGIMFALFPQIDIDISSLFYKPDEGFYLGEKPIFMAVYNGVNYLTVAIAVFFGLYLIASILKKSDVIMGIQRKTIIFLITTLIVAPGILVNVLLKEHVGRPRPQNITIFGGEKLFQPPFIISNECESNCSFVSGHASLGFYFMSFGLVAAAGFRRKFLLASGFALGWAIGLVRIIQGRHFFTDVLFAFFFVYATLVLVYDLFYGNKYGDNADNTTD